jgi:hypothetical protein
LPVNETATAAVESPAAGYRAIDAKPGHDLDGMTNRT